MKISNAKAIDRQEWISAIDSKVWASWKKSYYVWMVGSLCYYSFWVFKLQSDTQCRLIHLTAAKCAWKFKKTPCTCQLEKQCPSAW